MKKLNVILALISTALVFSSTAAYSMGIESYKLYREGDNNCRWEAPNKVVYTVWCGGSQNQVNDGMALIRDGESNARMELTLEGAVGPTCSLFHSNGPVANYSYTVDTGQSADVKSVFILEKEGDVSTPLAKWTTLEVVCLKL